MEHRQILLDQDGVLADFISGAIAAHGLSHSHDSVTHWDFYKDWGLTEDEFWAPCKGRDFWANLEPYPWAVEFYRRLSEDFPVTILSAPSNDPECTQGKYDWLAKHLGIQPSDAIMGKRKYLLSGPLNILIDDSPTNVVEFQKNGGLAIGFKQPWNKFTMDWQQILEELGQYICAGR